MKKSIYLHLKYKKHLKFETLTVELHSNRDSNGPYELLSAKLSNANKNKTHTNEQKNYFNGMNILQKQHFIFVS